MFQPTARDLEFTYRFQDDVHGHIELNRLERDCIDAPEFQRLFRVGQLGLVDLLYPTANHTRAVHSIGACAVAQSLIRHLNDSLRLNREDNLPTLLAPSETLLIRLAALLHDLPHTPFSHDLERKSHELRLNSKPAEKPRKGPKYRSAYGRYAKHDDFTTNPTLYTFLLRPSHSILARVLRAYSTPFLTVLAQDAADYPHLRDIAEPLALWDDASTLLLPSLLFHLFLVDKPEDAAQTSWPVAVAFHSDGSVRQADWGIGDPQVRERFHKAWYQPYRHDIVGNTLCADLIDYLSRDTSRLGFSFSLDPHLLQSYRLAAVPSPERSELRCVVDLTDPKRGAIRSEALHDVFRLLEARHLIHEKAVHHRVVQAAIAMLNRAFLVWPGLAPDHSDLVGIVADDPVPKDAAPRPADRGDHRRNENPSLALSGDEWLIATLLARAQSAPDDANARSARDILLRIAERRLFKPLIVLPGNQASRAIAPDVRDPRDREILLRKLAAVVDSVRFSTFFLTISRLLEGYLDHSVASVAVFRQHLHAISELENLPATREITSSRVIFWAPPYKQLFKDPALYVRVQVDETASVVRLDEARADVGLGEAALQERLTQLLDEAEGRYAALWKLYVFVSDGLLYTGVLEALLHGPCAGDSARHAQHIARAQNMAVTALRVAYAFYAKNSSDDNPLDLEAPMGGPELHALLEEMAASLETEPSSRPVGVTPTAYAHDASNLSNCRDVRFRFALPATQQEVKPHIQRVLDLAATTGASLSVHDLSDLDGRIRPGDFEMLTEDGLDAALRRIWTRDIPRSRTEEERLILLRKVQRARPQMTAAHLLRLQERMIQIQSGEVGLRLELDALLQEADRIIASPVGGLFGGGLAQSQS